MPELTDIQAWLHTFVVEPGTADDALKAAESKAGFAAGSAEELILPSPTLKPKERIQIYRNMYLLRMYDALEIDFPTILDRLGRERFRELVAEYVQVHPSRSHTLDHLGGNFPTFIKNHKTLDDAAPLAELAQLEWSLCEVAIAIDTPVLSLVDLAAVEPDSFVQLRFQPVAALQTLEFEYNINSYYKAWTNDEALPDFTKQSTRLVAWRHELRAWRQELSEPAWNFLQHLISGKCLGEALDLVIENSGESEEQLFQWFQEWVGDGFFSSFFLPD